MTNLEKLLLHTRGEVAVLYELKELGINLRKLQSEVRQLEDKRLELILEAKFTFDTPAAKIAKTVGLSYQRVIQLVARFVEEKKLEDDLAEERAELLQRLKDKA